MSADEKRPAALDHEGSGPSRSIEVASASHDTDSQNSAPSTAVGKSISARHGAAGELRSDPNTAISFLQLWSPGGSWPLTFITPDGGITTETFGPVDVDSGALRKRLLQAENQANCYFMVNAAKGPLGKKAKKSDVAQAVALHVDVDPRVGEDPVEERARILKLLQNHEPAPSVIIDSGGGYQAFWRLPTPVQIDGDEAKCADFEQYNRRLENELGGDHCHNIDRVMRLPGSINLPNATKRKKGRVPALAKLVSFDPDLVYELAQFKQAPALPDANAPPAKASAAKKATPSATGAAVDIAKLPVSDRCKRIIVCGDPEVREPSQPYAEGQRSEPVFGVVCELVRAGVPDDVINSVLLDRDLWVSGHVLDQKHPRQYAEKQIRSARGKTAAVSGDRVVIDINGDLSQSLDKAEHALLSTGAPLFQRAGSLVRVYRLDHEHEPVDGVHRHQGALTITEANVYWLREQMLLAADFERFDARTSKMAKTKPGEQFVNHYRLGRAGQWRAPVLSGIIEAPTLRRDGSLLQTPGYDEESGLILDTGGVQFPLVEEAPTKAQAEAALALFVDTVRAFPFAPEIMDDAWFPSANEGKTASVARSVALSAWLTGLVRRSLSAAPMHIFTARAAGTGKSMLVDMIATITTGRKATAMSQGGDEVEDEKRLFASLWAGDTCIAIDNIERPLEGAALCSILTQEWWKGRVLGQSQNVPLRTAALFLATGNNVKVRGDLPRRCVVCSLDARVEHPSQREFDFNALQLVAERRVELVTAGLTILRAYIAAGSPRAFTDNQRLSAVGGFEEWDLVRGALMWLGQPDPARSQNRLHDENPKAEELGELMDRWSACFGDRWLTAGEALGRAAGHDNAIGNDADPTHNALWRCIEGLTIRGDMTANGLGKWLSDRVGEVVRGRAVSSKGGGKLAKLYRVTKVGAP